MKKIVYFAALIAFMMSCGNSTVESVGFDKYINIKGEKMHISQHLTRANKIAVGDDYLVVNNMNDNTLYTAVNICNRQVTHFGKITEVAKGSPFMVKDSTLTLFDNSSRTLYQYNLNRITEPEFAVTPVSHINLLRVKSIASYDDSKFMMTGIFNDGMIAIVDKEDYSFKYDYTYKCNLTLANTPYFVMSEGYQTSICVEPVNKTIALTSTYADIIYTLDCDSLGYKLKEQKRRVMSYPCFIGRDKSYNPQFKPSNQTKWSYLSTAGNSQYVYSLWLGVRGVRPNKYGTSRTIRVFDWKCEPHYTLKLDYDCLSIAIKENRLWALIIDKHGVLDIVEYDLSQIDNSKI